MPQNKRRSWPVLKSYTGENIHHVALPLGGIGTGTVSLGGRGDLRDWEIMSRPAKGFSPVMTPDLAPISPFLAVRAKAPGQAPVAKLLEGPYPDAFKEGPMGTTAPNHGMPRFEKAVFHAAYPFGRVELTDRTFPLKAEVEGFNPFVPGDSEASGLPVAVLRVTLRNPGKRAVAASVCFNLPNFIGDDGEEGSADFFRSTGKLNREKRNRNRFRKAGRLRGIFMDSAGLPADDEAAGTIALATDHAGALTHRTNWAPFDGGDPRQEFWDDFLEDGALKDYRKKKFPHPCGSLCVSLRVPAGGEKTVAFYLAWRFPNRNTWTKKLEGEKEPCGKDCGCDDGRDPDNVGNHYALAYRDAWDAVKKIVPRLPALEKQTAAFTASVVESDLPEAVREAALFNLSTLRSPTVFRIRTGHLCAWEGVLDHVGCCAGSCTHVWNYETATGGLFGDLARGMREVEFRYNTDETGRQCFRTPLPFGRKQKYSWIAADGQTGTIVRLYREWRRSGDDDFLRDLWPHARRALEFCWIKGGWDADRDGVMEGCQHNTMDVEYFGPNPQMTGWYLAALRATEAMARHLGENDFAGECRRIHESGSKKVDTLFNGEYYEHHIVPRRRRDIAEGLLLGEGAAAVQNPEDPIKQLGAGCLVDQLVGAYQAALNGLGDVLPETRQRKTLRSILKHNFRRDFRGHFNHLRSYVAPEDAGLLMATYPKGRRPQRPFPYWNEVMTGFEYTAAGHMLLLGMEKEGLRCIEAIRARYDGRRRNPFNEAECGHHYARALAAWSALEAWTGFQCSAVDGTIRFRAREGRFPWADGHAWGTVEMKRLKSGWQVRLHTLGGTLRARTLELDGVGRAKLKRGREVSVRVG